MKTVLGADPFVLFDPISKLYYLYCTDNDGRYPFLVYESSDLINWIKKGVGLDRDKNDWGKGWFWAPEVYYNENNNLYYMFYSALVKDELVKKYFNDDKYIECTKIGVATSRSPLGPFANITNEPIDYYPYDRNYIDIESIYLDPFRLDENSNNNKNIKKGVYVPSIDANLFIDDDRKMYLYFSRNCYKNCVFDEDNKKYIEESNILGVELDSSFWFDKTGKSMPKINRDFVGFLKKEVGNRADKFIQIISYHNEPQAWENGHINDYELSNGAKHNRRWSEGSTIISKTINGKKLYYIFYSCNNFENSLYGVGYGTSFSPLSCFKKNKFNPLISQDCSIPIYSTGHGCIIEKNDKTYYFFHGRNNVKNRRICYLTELVFNEDYTVYHKDIICCNLIQKGGENI